MANVFGDKEMKKTTASIPRALSLVASHLEAASSLIKYAADDLTEILPQDGLELADDVRQIVENLQAQAITIAGSGAFFLRLAEDHVANAETEDSQAGFAMGD